MPSPSHLCEPIRPIRVAALLLTLLASLALAACGEAEREGDGASTEEAGFDATRAFADLRHQVEIGPRPSGSAAAERTARWIERSLREAGAAEPRIQRPLRNVVATIPGEQPGYVVLGAHYDTKDSIPGFVGANDGASGVATVLEIARTLPSPLPGPAVAIALFDGEEARGDRPFEVDGLRGSRQYVEFAGEQPAEARQGTPPLAEIKAMALVEMVGDCDLSIPREANSDPALHAHFAAEDPELLAGEATPILDDHIPFLEAGIPAVNLIDFKYGPGPQPGQWWHTADDTADKLCAESLGAVGAVLERGLMRADGLG